VRPRVARCGRAAQQVVLIVTRTRAAGWAATTRLLLEAGADPFVTFRYAGRDWTLIESARDELSRGSGPMHCDWAGCISLLLEHQRKNASPVVQPPPQPQPQPQPPSPAAARVRLRGLSAGDLNGCEGVRGDYSQSRGRYKVRLDGGRTVFVRPANIELLSPPSSLAGQGGMEDID
jgi:hypothetical protein